MKNLINWLALSRHITGGKWDSIRPGKYAKKHIPKLDQFFHNDLPEWWDKEKKS